MPAVHCFIHDWSGESPTSAADGINPGRISVQPEQLRVPLSVTFDELAAQLASLPGGYCEPDGAFGWHPATDPATRLVGTLHAFDERVMCVELHGEFSRAGWERLLRLFGPPEKLLVQWVEEGRFEGAAQVGARWA